MALTKPALRNLYRRRARHYDLTANAYYAIGFREYAYRRRAVASLRLERGATVVDLCCGTGLNFRYLHDAVGPSGTIIGVDLTDEMLARATDRVADAGWTNVELVESDVAQFRLPPRVDGVISTFAITLVPEFASVLSRAYRCLAPSGALVVLDFKEPDWAPEFLIRIGVAATRPFGVTRDLGKRHPCQVLRRLSDSTRVETLYFGFAYIAQAYRCVLTQECGA